MSQAPAKIWIRKTQSSKLILLIHGFGGAADKTFGLFPAFLAGDSNFAAWDIATIGYPTSLSPDFSGVWSADPDLASLAGYLDGLINDIDYQSYQDITLMAHSMGGLIVQRALLNGGITDRIRHAILFGTPSGGLKKSLLAKIFKRQARDMNPEGTFIQSLRSDWKNQFSSATPFEFRSVAGLSDEFVPKRSSHGPFNHNREICKWVAGNHLDIVKPISTDTDSVNLVRHLLTPSVSEITSPKKVRDLAVEEYAEKLLTTSKEKPDWEALVREAAFDMEAKGAQGEAIKMLEGTGYESSELKGMLGGRLKRRWLADPDVNADAANRALDLYAAGYEQAKVENNHDQAFYNGINMAFMELAHKNNRDAALQLSQEILQHIQKDKQTHTEPDMWRAATHGEAMLYLDQPDTALKSYEEAIALNPDPRQRESMMQQAIWATRLLEDPTTEAQLLALFRYN